MIQSLLDSRYLWIKESKGLTTVHQFLVLLHPFKEAPKESFKNVIVKNESSSFYSFESYKGGDLDNYSSDELVSLLLESGSWTSIKEDLSALLLTQKKPSSIFVTAIDTNPLSFDPGLFIQKNQVAFNEGLKALAKIKGTPVHVCVKNGYRFSVPNSDQIEVHEFSGPHPSGNVGTHIHHRPCECI